MVKPRIPEGGAILDDEDLSMEEYSEQMKKLLGSEYRTIIKYIITKIKPPNNGKVLEIGSGPGWLGIWLAKARPDLSIDGLEPSPDMIRVAIHNAKEEKVIDQVHYLSGFVENMELIPNHTYDLVFSNDSLHHWEDPLKGFLEISRVLKPNGKLYIKDERRDLGIRAKFIVYIIGRLIAGKIWKYWKSSIDASYTPQELQQFINLGKLKDWVIKSNFLEITIEMKSI